MNPKDLNKSNEERAELYQKMIEDALAGLENIVYYVEQKQPWYAKNLIRK